MWPTGFRRFKVYRRMQCGTCRRRKIRLIWYPAKLVSRIGNIMSCGGIGRSDLQQANGINEKRSRLIRQRWKHQLYLLTQAQRTTCWEDFLYLKNCNVLYAAYMLRFKTNSLGEKRKGPVSVKELTKAERSIMKLTQQETFEPDLRALQHHRQISKGSKLAGLNPSLVPKMDSFVWVIDYHEQTFQKQKDIR